MTKDADRGEQLGEDQGELLGGLPRSRPGTRSAKRDSGPAGGEHTSHESPVEPDPADPVGDVLRTAGRAAQAGARIASDVTRELLRRLPRP